MFARRSIQNGVIFFLTILIYFGAGKLGLTFAFVNPSASAVWAPTGIALAIFILFGNQFWPAIFIGAFLVNVTTNGSIPTSILIAIGNTLEGLVGAFLVNRLIHGRKTFDRAQDIFEFALLAGLLSTTVSASIGVISLMLNGLVGPADYIHVWLTWWLGDATGALIVTPVIILWAIQPLPHWNFGRIAEALILVFGLVFLSLVVFGGYFNFAAKNYDLEFLVLPIMVWAALRFSQREVATFCLLLSGIAIWGTLRGFGPFASLYASDAYLVLQGFTGIISMTCLCVAAAVAERRQIEEEVKEANQRLQHGLKELERRNSETILLHEMGDLLQSCLALEETYPILSRSLALLFPDQSGACYIFNDTRSIMEARVLWGAQPPAETIFPPDDCWALRRGQIHTVAAGTDSLICAHFTPKPIFDYMCQPLIAQGKILGVLHVRGKDHLATPQKELVQAVGNALALAFANLNLSASLREQSIRDPLTDLFNRRYLEEALDRELARAKRNHQQVGLIMLDIDNFKLFNDAFGHLAGDQFLRSLGNLLKRSIRGGDIACRYGGEEFILLLPEATSDGAQRRAEQLRQEVKKLPSPDPGISWESITLSLGVALFPEHGETSQQIMQVVDSALYQAKREGKDRVIFAKTI
jgi:diguanylate cyclase (GGDEF)-like protein